MRPTTGSIHLNLDDAWGDHPLGIRTIDVREWGPRLRYFASDGVLFEFALTFLPALPPFNLYGSGDFHHLTAWLLHGIGDGVTVISFDNHPDWDVRPPRWACGAWVNRALARPNVSRVAVWGCGNFELTWPSLLFANRRARRQGRLVVHPWAERYSPRVAAHFDAMTRDTWRDRFDDFLRTLAGTNVYVTVDLDCLRSDEFSSNWEQGLFTADEVAWALRRVRETCRLVGGDACGAYSPFRGERTLQRLANWWDHPKLPPIDPEAVRARNLAALAKIWPALTA